MPNDTLRGETQTGGTVDLSGLASAGQTVFALEAVPYSLPALETATNVTFDVSAGLTLSLPGLRTYSGGVLTVRAGGSLSEPSPCAMACRPRSS